MSIAVRNGWRILRHPAFRETIDGLSRTVEALRRQQPATWKAHPKAKLLARITDLIEIEIPRDPNAAEFAQGNTLGPTHRHWRRAKFMSRFRLFFRFDSTSRIIIYAWVNDENSLRKAGSKTDPYAIFKRRLDAGNPPDDWVDLLRHASE